MLAAHIVSHISDGKCEQFSRSFLPLMVAHLQLDQW